MQHPESNSRPHALVALLLALLLPTVGTSTETPLPGSTKAPAVVPRQVTALLGGLAPGRKLAGWTVRSIRGPRDGVVSIEVARKKASFNVTFASRGAKSFNPPLYTQKYALFYDGFSPDSTAVTHDELLAVLQAVATPIARHELKLPVPPGM